jgi:hypothetical protein
MPQVQEQVKKLINFYENISLLNLSDLRIYYSKNAAFKDPFNEVSGVEKIEKIFEHMFESLKNPLFKVKDVASQEHHTFITWVFYYELKQMPSKGMMEIKGASHIVWDYNESQNIWQIISHRDYWDAAEEVYENIPLLGHVLKWLKKKLST